MSKVYFSSSVFSLSLLIFQKPKQKTAFPSNILRPQATMSLSLAEATWIWPPQNKILNIK